MKKRHFKKYIAPYASSDNQFRRDPNFQIFISIFIIFTIISYHYLLLLLLLSYYFLGQRWEPAAKTQINKNKKQWARDTAKAADKAKKDLVKEADDSAKRQKNLEEAQDLGKLKMCYIRV